MLKPFLAVFVLCALGVSMIHPKDLFTWFLEIIPILVAAPALFFTRRIFPLTNLLAVLIALHSVVLMMGGHYTYAETPLGFWMQDVFGFTRNHYDRIGHFMQGFVPALFLREVLLRRTKLGRGFMLPFLCVCFALAVSASYEIFEMIVSLMTGEAAESFLGTQGDVWDTQMDMAFCLIGGLASLMLAPLHDRQIKGMKE